MFDSVLGIMLANADVLRQAVLEAAANSDQAESRGDDGFGEIHVLHFAMKTVMAPEIHMHDVVALLEDTPARHFETGQSLVLRRGQLGTVVMTYDGTAFDVEFAGRDGRAYALLPIGGEKLMRLHDTPEYGAA